MQISLEEKNKKKTENLLYFAILFSETLHNFESIKVWKEGIFACEKADIVLNFGILSRPGHSKSMQQQFKKKIELFRA